MRRGLAASWPSPLGGEGDPEADQDAAGPAHETVRQPRPPDHAAGSAQNKGIQGYPIVIAFCMTRMTAGPGIKTSNATSATKAK